MKKIYLFLSLIAASCSNTSTAQKNVEQFVKDNLNTSLLLDIDNVKSIEIGNADTIISPVVLSFVKKDLDDANLSYKKREITHDSLMAVVRDCEQKIFDVTFSAEMETTKQLKEKYHNLLRSSYPVKVTTKSGATKEVSVVMDRDGVTPTRFLHESLKEIESISAISYPL